MRATSEAGPIKRKGITIIVITGTILFLLPQALRCSCIVWLHFLCVNHALYLVSSCSWSLDRMVTTHSHRLIAFVQRRYCIQGTGLVTCRTRVLIDGEALAFVLCVCVVAAAAHRACCDFLAFSLAQVAPSSWFVISGSFSVRRRTTLHAECVLPCNKHTFLSHKPTRTPSRVLVVIIKYVPRSISKEDFETSCLMFE